MKIKNEMKYSCVKEALIRWVLGTDGQNGETCELIDAIPWGEEIESVIPWNDVYDEIKDSFGCRTDENNKWWDVGIILTKANELERFMSFIIEKTNKVMTVYQGIIDKANKLCKIKKEIVMKQTFEGWTIATKVVEMFEERTYFMGIHTNYAGNKYVTLETYPTHISVLKNLFETKEAAIDFWKNGMWELCVARDAISVLPVKIKVDIDVACLGLDWNGIM